jgi:hypothetical protein
MREPNRLQREVPEMTNRRFVARSALVVLALLGVLVCGAPAANAQAEGNPKSLLAPGDPPLTVELSDRATDFIEWLLDVPLTTEQRQTIREALIETWKGPDRENVQGVLDLLQLEAQVKELGEPQRLALREQLQPALVQQLRESPQDEGARWLLAIYETGHQPIAEGDPPLTRQVTDAYAEFIGFVVAQAMGQELAVPAEFKDEFAKTLAAGYPKLSADERKELAQMPAAWAAVRMAWPELPDEQKQQYRARWAEGLKALLPPEPQAKEPEPAAGQPAQGAEGQAGGKSGMSALQESMAASRRAQILSNIMQMQHETSMAIISNIGGGGWRYEYRY